MIGDLKISFKAVPATANKHSYVQMVASINGTRFRMALKQLVFSGSQEELTTVSSTLFRIYKEAQLQGKHITAQALKKQFLSPPPTLLYRAICRSNNDHLLNLGKTISYKQYQFQLLVIQQIPVFCQLHYGLPDISISTLPDNFLSQFRDFLYRQQTIEKCDIEEQIRFIRTTLLKEHQKGNIELSIPLKEQLTNFHIPNKRLIPEDICKLVETHLPQHLATIRDTFVFGCYTDLLQ